MFNTITINNCVGDIKPNYNHLFPLTFIDCCILRRIQILKCGQSRRKFFLTERKPAHNELATATKPALVGLCKGLPLLRLQASVMGKFKK